MPPPKPPKPPQDRADRPRRGVPVPRPPIGYKGGDGEPTTFERKAPPPGRVPPPRPRFDKPRGERAYRPPPRGTPPPAAWEKPRPGAPPRPRFDNPRPGAPPERPRFEKPRPGAAPQRPRLDKPRTGAPPRFDRPRDGGAPRSNDRPRSAPSRDSSPRSNDRPRFDRPRIGGAPRSNDRPRSGPPRFDGPRRDAPRDSSPRGARPHDGRPPRPQFPARPAKDPNEPVLAVRTRKPRYARPGDPVPVVTPLVVLYEDGEVLAVEKPAGINVAQENETDLIPSLQTRASEYLLAKNEGTALIGPRARLVHRIDKDTSGVVLFAKTPRAQSILGREWEASRVEKIYLAIVRGVPELESGVVDAPIGRDHGRKNLRAIGGLDPQEARTKFRVVERFAGGRYSLLEARPLTGRTHQIRVHLASLGCPLAIDPLYGDSSLSRPPEITRLTLHASTLTFPAPSDSKPRTAHAALPPDFARALDSLRKMPDSPLPPPATPAAGPRARRRKV